MGKGGGGRKALGKRTTWAKLSLGGKTGTILVAKVLAKKDLKDKKKRILGYKRRKGGRGQRSDREALGVRWARSSYTPAEVKAKGGKGIVGQAVEYK